MKKHLTWVASLFLFVTWFFTNEISSIIRYIDIGFFLKYIGVYTIIAASIYFLFYYFTRKADKSWLLTQVLVFFLLMFGHSRDFLTSKFLILEKYGYSVPLWIILMGLTFFLVLKKSFNYQKLRNFVLLVLGILIIYSIVDGFRKSPAPAIIQNKITEQPQPTAKPNIYFFIFDELVRSDRLADLGYNNQEFIDSLSKINVQYISNTHSYTDLTSLCVPSIFNVTKPDFTKINIPISNQELFVIWNEYKKNGLQTYLKNIGYKTSLYGIMPMEGFPNQSGMKYQDFLMDDLLRQNTFWGRTNMQLGEKISLSNIPLVNSFFFELQQGYGRKIFENDQNNLAQIKKSLTVQNTEEPEFLVGHFLFPHAPMIRDRNGNYLSKEALKDTISETVKYIEQVKYTEKTILELTHLIQKKDSNAIILFMGDHGYREMEDSIYSIQPFLAIYDGQNNIPYNDSITSVNLLRSILNQRFNFKFEPLSDSTQLVFKNRTMH